jgi:diguanylate cyclase (GGDEF)-like protein
MKIFAVHSIVVKTVLLLLFLTALTLAVFAVALFPYQRDMITENAVLNAQNASVKLKAKIDRIASAGDMSPATINSIIKEALSLGGGTLTLYGQGGDVVVNVENNQIVAKTSVSDRERSIVAKAIAGQSSEGAPFYQEADVRQRTVSLFIPFIYSKDKNGVAAVTFALNDIDERLLNLSMRYLLIGGAVIAVWVICAIVLFRMVLSPLRRISRGACQIAEGKLEVHVPLGRNDEIGALASAVNEMGVTLRRMHYEAKGTTPLTGLPGQIAVYNYLNDCIINARVICALYCDLSNFKAYNDKYGFTKGDEVIIYTRDCLRLAAKKSNLSNVFIGHEGGDDFVVITEYEQWEIFAKAFVAFFDKGIHSFYNETDARNGYMESINRRGENQHIPLMSVSVAVVTNKTRDFRSVAEIIQIADEVKQYLKSREGSCYAIDRRTGPPRSASTAPLPGAAVPPPPA